MSNNLNELKEIADQQSNKLLSDTGKLISELHDVLTAPIARASLPEVVFKEYFLDMFLSGLTEDTKGYAAKWIELAGGAFREVSIIDSQGNELFVAPSLYLPPTVDNDIIRSMNIYEVSGTYNLKRKIHEGQAKQYLASSLSGLPDSVHSTLSKHIIRIANINERYRGKTEDLTKPAIAKPKAKEDLDDKLFTFQ